MTDIALATMSTALWLIATVALFILLAGWSTGSSWGLTATLVRGVRGWSDGAGRPMRVASPPSEPLRPILDPYAFVRRGGPRASSPEGAGAVVDSWATTGPGTLGAEMIDLGERRLPD